MLFLQWEVRGGQPGRVLGKEGAMSEDRKRGIPRRKEVTDPILALVRVTSGNPQGLPKLVLVLVLGSGV